MRRCTVSLVLLPGIELCLYFKTMHIFLAHRRACLKSNVFYVVFSSVMFALIVIFVTIEGMLGGCRIKTTREGQSHTCRDVQYQIQQTVGIAD